MACVLFGSKIQTGEREEEKRSLNRLACALASADQTSVILDLFGSRKETTRTADLEVIGTKETDTGVGLQNEECAWCGIYLQLFLSKQHSILIYTLRRNTGSNLQGLQL